MIPIISFFDQLDQVITMLHYHDIIMSLAIKIKLSNVITFQIERFKINILWCLSQVKLDYWI